MNETSGGRDGRAGITRETSRGDWASWDYEGKQQGRQGELGLLGRKGKACTAGWDYSEETAGLAGRVSD